MANTICFKNKINAFCRLVVFLLQFCRMSFMAWSVLPVKKVSDNPF